jgi:hypothetical protein
VVICNLKLLWNIRYPHTQARWHWDLNLCQFHGLSTFLHDYWLQTWKNIGYLPKRLQGFTTQNQFCY